VSAADVAVEVDVLAVVDDGVVSDVPAPMTLVLTLMLKLLLIDAFFAVVVTIVGDDVVGVVVPIVSVFYKDHDVNVLDAVVVVAVVDSNGVGVVAPIVSMTLMQMLLMLLLTLMALVLLLLLFLHF